jgi:hypothetical protein
MSYDLTGEPGMTVGDDGRGSPARVIEPFQCASLS